MPQYLLPTVILLESALKIMQSKGLQRITVVGLGLLGGSVALAAADRLPGTEVTGFAHRAQTRRRARQLGIAHEVSGDLAASVRRSQLVVLATPVCAFEGLLRGIARALPDGCVVTDVGSTKVQVHRWAAANLPRSVVYVGSHPMAGSEQRGIDWARADLLDGAICFVTTSGTTDPTAVRLVSDFWAHLGCTVRRMTASQHDRIVAAISHVPQAAATALVNATSIRDLPYAGKGFMDTTRIASSPADVWADILLTNRGHVTRGIDRVVRELGRLREAIGRQDRPRIERLLTRARDVRQGMVDRRAQGKGLAT